MNPFLQHYIQHRVVTKTAAAAGPITSFVLKALGGASAGTAVAGAEQYGVNKGLGEVGIKPITGYGSGVSYGVNALAGAAQMFPGGRQAVKPITLAGIQALQPGLMNSDRALHRGADMIKSITGAADKVSDVSTQLTTGSGDKPGAIDQVTSKIVGEPARKIRQDGQVVTVPAQTGLVDELKGTLATASETMEKVKAVVPDIQGLQQSVPEIRDVAKSFARAIDPRWMIGTTAAVGVPWMGYELWKRNRAHQKALASEKKQERLMGSLDRIATSLSKQQA